MATEKSMLDHINDLVAEEKQLRSSSHEHTDETRARLRHLEEELDQCWDMLRQRRAKDEFDQPADDVKERPVGEVEGYLQ
jgi:ferritin-like metal-binding protein YciE